nr:6-phosphofructokinase [Geotalea toluenoxydans]
MCQQLRARYEEGRDNAIIILAEGAGNAHQIADSIKDAIGFETRVTVLGHYQRGGAPTVFDRLLASRLGKNAVDLLLAGKKGSWWVSPTTPSSPAHWRMWSRGKKSPTTRCCGWRRCWGYRWRASKAE